jgi:hypothetical protein
MPLSRTSVIVMSYLIACLVVVITPVTVVQIAILMPLGRIPDWWSLGLLNQASGGAVILSLFAVLAGALPAYVAIVYAERRSIRSAWFYGLAGIGAAWFTTSRLLADFVQHSSLTAAVLGLLLVSFVGLLGGVTYWALAGRHAGVSSTPAKPI